MSEKGADIRMKWLRKRKQTDQVEANEATPDLEVHKQDENVANNEAKYIDDKKHLLNGLRARFLSLQMNLSSKFAMWNDPSKWAVKSCMS
ncbi:hypothetical protein PAV_4c05550 [Paenibacillus alvei DSM 29]|nr:hypothetical protein [Paenibacillus alvei]EJW17448.1 hypothetical protein PAV_4c05550 [Paenibacillus alvei DSM 29]